MQIFKNDLNVFISFKVSFLTKILSFLFNLKFLKELMTKQKPEFYQFIAECPNVLECNCVTGKFSMLIKVAFPSTQELDLFIGQLQRFGNTSTQIVFSTPVPHRDVAILAED
ncbi:MAG: Lrp/AsnC ligand binding domain-containing protein [Malacoplasma sp.]|nr:Lrp/AsnC ligand binding domain-containing protein [Malacoplasma sp.]